jgi:hypothetical protein
MGVFVTDDGQTVAPKRSRGYVERLTSQPNINPFTDPDIAEARYAKYAARVRTVSEDEDGVVTPQVGTV